MIRFEAGGAAGGDGKRRKDRRLSKAVGRGAGDDLGGRAGLGCVRNVGSADGCVADDDRGGRRGRCDGTELLGGPVTKLRDGGSSGGGDIATEKELGLTFAAAMAESCVPRVRVAPPSNLEAERIYRHPKF